MKKYKVNYHLTEYCNFHCKFCFARYETKKLILDQQLEVIDHIANCGLFNAINFAGGEPLLDSNILTLVKHAKEMGLKVSIITNGYLLNDEMLKQMVPYLDMLGISVHSFSENVKIEIGSCTSSGKTLTNERLEDIFHIAQSINPNCKLKINTVVCSKNYMETLLGNITSISNISKWKCFKCQEFRKNDYMCVSKEQYELFKCNNKTTEVNQVFEEDMKSSYIMVNPNGELIKPFSKDYIVIGSMLHGDIRQMISELRLDLSEYERRYK